MQSPIKDMIRGHGKLTEDQSLLLHTRSFAALPSENSNLMFITVYYESPKRVIEASLKLGCSSPPKASTLSLCRDCSPCFLKGARVSRYCFYGSLWRRSSL